MRPCRGLVLGLDLSSVPRSDDPRRTCRVAGLCPSEHSSHLDLKSGRDRGIGARWGGFILCVPSRGVRRPTRHAGKHAPGPPALMGLDLCSFPRSVVPRPTRRVAGLCPGAPGVCRLVPWPGPGSKSKLSFSKSDASVRSQIAKHVDSLQHKRSFVATHEFASIYLSKNACGLHSFTGTGYIRATYLTDEAPASARAAQRRSAP